MRAWHTLPTKYTRSIQLIGNHTHSRIIWETILHAMFKNCTSLRLIKLLSTISR
jgi:hypothetical protein